MGMILSHLMFVLQRVDIPHRTIAYLYMYIYMCVCVCACVRVHCMYVL